jgi:small subunit ribosomal protein S17
MASVKKIITEAATKVAEAVGLKSAEPEKPARPQLRTIQGVVASDKADKTIKVVVEYQTRHAKYGKYLKRRTVLHAHDERNDAHEGDTVEIAECRPLSKTKHHRLVRIVERAPERAVQVSAEEVMTGKAPEER